MSHGIAAISRGRISITQRRSASGSRSVSSPVWSGGSGASPGAGGGAAERPPQRDAARAATTPPRNPRRVSAADTASLDGEASKAAVLRSDPNKVTLPLLELGLVVLYHFAVEVDGPTLEEPAAVRA